MARGREVKTDTGNVKRCGLYGKSGLVMEPKGGFESIEEEVVLLEPEGRDNFYRGDTTTKVSTVNKEDSVARSVLQLMNNYRVRRSEDLSSPKESVETYSVNHILSSTSFRGLGTHY